MIGQLKRDVIGYFSIAASLYFKQIKVTSSFS